MENVVSLLQNHRSIRKFTGRKVEKETITQIILAAQMASTSSHFQAYSIIGVTDQTKKDKLSELSGNAHVSSCDHFLVFCADLHRIEKASEREGRNVTENLEYTENFIVATVDASLAAQNAAIAAESMGLGITYVGGIRNNPQGVSEILGLPQKVYPVFGMCVGYPDQDPDVKPRLPLESVYYENHYKSFEQIVPYLDSYNKIIEEYYLKRTNGTKGETWTDKVSDNLLQKARTHMKDFLANQGFPLK